MFRKLFPVLLGAVLALFALTTMALASANEPSFTAPADDIAFTASVTGTTPTTPTAPGQLKLATVIAKAFGVSILDVMAIRQQNLGWGEVYKVFLLAKLSNQDPEDILALRQDKKGWGQIYKELGVRPGKGENLGQSKKADQTPQTPGNKPSVPPGLSNKPDKGTNENANTDDQPGNGRGRGNNKNKPK